jgi:DNA-binding response OmpR family regulator
MHELKVLYLEDEHSLGKITSDILSKSGFLVDWIQDGTTGLSKFRSNSYDICVVDIMMPGMDGYAFVNELRKIDENVPVIFLTARSLTEDVIKGFETGGNDYLKKPFSIEELIVRMNALLKRVRVEPVEKPTVLQVGQYTLKYESMELIHAGKSQVLTHRENELLYRLILHKNHVLDRQKVLLELWGDDTFFNARSMDVFITKLRKYLAADVQLSIVNIRGIGYKLILRE